jgi:hypothetical protein
MPAIIFNARGFSRARSCSVSPKDRGAPVANVFSELDEADGRAHDVFERGRVLLCE